MVKRNHSFIANRSRGHAANCVPYLTPPVLENIAAFPAKPLPLVAWPPALPWEHSSRWSYPSPRDSSHSDADHGPWPGRLIRLPDDANCWAKLHVWQRSPSSERYRKLTAPADKRAAIAREMDPNMAPPARL